MYHQPREWNAQYDSGVWDYLGALEQRPRYAIIASWIHLLNPRARILDIGCGEGHLAGLLQPEAVGTYTGADFSSVAIGRARARWAAAATYEFIVADADTMPASRYSDADVIIFNEVLYCLKDPVAAVSRALESRAHVLISITDQHRDTATLLRRLFSREVVEWVTCADELRTKAWIIGMLRSTSSAAT